MDYVFVFDKGSTRNAGMLVEQLNNCYVLEQKISDDAFLRSRFKNTTQLYGPQQGEQLKGKRVVKMNLIGQKRKIIKGRYKGYLGIIKNISDKNVQFEIQAISKLITLPIEFFNIEGNYQDLLLNNQQSAENYRSQATPYLNVATPAYNNQNY